MREREDKRRARARARATGERGEGRKAFQSSGETREDKARQGWEARRRVRGDKEGKEGMETMIRSPTLSEARRSN